MGFRPSLISRWWIVLDLVRSWHDASVTLARGQRLYLTVRWLRPLRVRSPPGRARLPPGDLYADYVPSDHPTTQIALSRPTTLSDHPPPSGWTIRPPSATRCRGVRLAPCWRGIIS